MNSDHFFIDDTSWKFELKFKKGDWCPADQRVYSPSFKTAFGFPKG